MTNVQVYVNGDLSKALKRFKKAWELVLSDVRRTEYFVPPSVKRRLKRLRARKRARKVTGLFGDERS